MRIDEKDLCLKYARSSEIIFNTVLYLSETRCLSTDTCYINNLENITISERSQSQNTTYGIILFI